MQLDPVGGAVRDARRVVESALSGWQDDAAAQVAVLLTSELVTNAIVHASPHASDGRVGLTVDGDDELARIEVTDGYAVLPVVRGLRVDGTSGRGVMLLDLLAARWGITRWRRGQDRVV